MGDLTLQFGFVNGETAMLSSMGDAFLSHVMRICWCLFRMFNYLFNLFFFNQFFVLGRLIAPYSFIDGCTDQWSVFCFRRGFKCQSFADLVLHFPSHFQSLQHLLLQIPYPLSTALHLGLLASQLEMESICLIFVFLDALASPSSHPCQRVGQWLIVF